MLLSRVPVPPLSRFVSVLWYARDWKPGHPRERHMPDGSAGLIISLGDDSGARAGGTAIVSGPRCSSFVIRYRGAPGTLIGAQFTHGGAAAFFDVPLSALRNAHVPLADLAGHSGALLRERLLAIPRARARLDSLERWLCERMSGPCGPDGAVVWAVEALRRPRARVRDVTASIGRSSRWFIDRFARDVGLTPKVFSRVQRFQAALRHAYGRPIVDLADLAAAAGYFDQSHMTHEFNVLAGMSPSDLLSGRTPFLNHVVERD